MVANMVPHIYGDEPWGVVIPQEVAIEFPMFMGLNRLVRRTDTLISRVPHIYGAEP